MTPIKFFSGQLRKPSGWFGRLVMARFFNRYNQRIIELAIRALDIHADDRVLDIGFGGGVSLGIIAKTSAGKVYGVDLSEDMVRVARKRFDRLIRLGRLDVKAGDIAQLPYGNESFDKVCTINTLYFWSDPVRMLAEIRRVLRPGGRLVIAFRSRQKMKAMQMFLHGFTLYSLEEVRDLLLRARFQDVRMDCYDQHKLLDSNLAIGTA
jgi:ubiquinone/menaquinone biosynthesis C-methylase UbiE